MILPQSEHEFINALYKAAELGANRALEQANLLKPYISLRDAQRKYGVTIVKRWIDEGLIQVIKDGNATSKIRIERARIEAVAAASNRNTYMPTKRRER
jgi:hypothetical protein